jgi:hypothetical protein
MTQQRALTLFAALFAVFYLVAVEMNWALITYHPRQEAWGWGAQAATKGPAMHWYGWLASAALAATVATLIAVPVLKRVAIPTWIGWAAPLAVIVAFVWVLRIFFFR